MSLPLPHSLKNKQTRQIQIVASLALCLCISCQPATFNERDFFDSAENAYKEGNYEEATTQYKKFLESSPDPQLARLAERRLLAIEREIDNVMSRKNGPRPVYMNNDPDMQETKDPGLFFQKKQPR